MNREQEKNRELTAAEKVRKENFEKIKKNLNSQGFEEKDLTVGIVYANVMAFVLTAPFIILLSVWFALRNISDFTEFLISASENMITGLLIFFAAFFVLTVAHELIHGITWSIFTKKHWKAISFGFIAKYMTPYCSCDEALKKWQYIVGSLMPTIILGVIPAIVSVFTGSLLLFGIGALMILAGGGDLTIVLKLIMFRSCGKEVLYMDHPYQAGLVAFVR